VLWAGHGYGVVARPDGTVELDIDGATDLELNPAGVLVIARAPGRPFRRFARDAVGWRELEPLNAPGYDGGAITVNPSGRVVFTTAAGYASTAGSAAQHVTSGQVITYRLDSGVYRTRWGRMFVDACIPVGTSVRARFLTTDLDDVTDPVDPSPAARAIGRPPHPEDTPPLPSSSLLDQDETTWSLFRRPNGREEPWKQISADDPLETYEVPVHALPGRYLWIVLELTGTELVTPRVGALRVERPGHGLLGSLPRGWSRDDGDADFTQRYLAPLDGLLHELDTKEALRAILLDPRSTPQETLPWLASFAGLILDRRWPETARRTLVAEAYTLFSRRGTKVALLRLLAIYLGRTPSIVEAWQLRGLGGTILGLQPGGTPAPAIGGGSSATAMLGRFTIGGQLESTDSYQESAHRFTMLVPGELTSEQSSARGCGSASGCASHLRPLSVPAPAGRRPWSATAGSATTGSSTSPPTARESASPGSGRWSCDDHASHRRANRDCLRTGRRGYPRPRRRPPAASGRRPRASTPAGRARAQRRRVVRAPCRDVFRLRP
jgi:phage tail-like protein